MDQTSQLEILEAQIRECYGRIVWTHKTQEKCADILNSRNDWIKLWQIILSAITTSGISFSVFANNKCAGIISVLISFVLVILNTLVKKYDLGGMAQKHADAAASIWNIRESYLSLLTDIRAEMLSCDEIRKIRDKLQIDLHKLYKGSPRTITKAYTEASKALKKMEEMTFSDEEIDNFLPKSLRKVQ
ncbi:MAG: SLATT domain-containing protein [Methylococcales bacterium]|nr:SLATT domain-containing protein [Methylococcales bacterium]